MVCSFGDGLVLRRSVVVASALWSFSRFLLFRFSTLPQHRMPATASFWERSCGQAVRGSEAWRAELVCVPEGGWCCVMVQA